MVSEFEKIKAEFDEIDKEEELTRNNDVIQRTISKLLAIEKKSLYGVHRSKNKLMENVLVEELKNYKDSMNDTKKN